MSDERNTPRSKQDSFAETVKESIDRRVDEKFDEVFSEKKVDSIYPECVKQTSMLGDVLVQLGDSAKERTARKRRERRSEVVVAVVIIIQVTLQIVLELIRRGHGP